MFSESVKLKPNRFYIVSQSFFLQSPGIFYDHHKVSCSVTWNVEYNKSDPPWTWKSSWSIFFTILHIWTTIRSEICKLWRPKQLEKAKFAIEPLQITSICPDINHPFNDWWKNDWSELRQSCNTIIDFNYLQIVAANPTNPWKWTVSCRYQYRIAKISAELKWMMHAYNPSVK